MGRQLVEGDEGSTIEKAFKGERVKRWLAPPFKGEKVKMWKGEKMANATYTFGLTP